MSATAGTTLSNQELRRANLSLHPAQNAHRPGTPTTTKNMHKPASTNAYIPNPAPPLTFSVWTPPPVRQISRADRRTTQNPPQPDNREPKDMHKLTLKELQDIRTRARPSPKRPPGCVSPRRPEPPPRSDQVRCCRFASIRPISHGHKQVS